MSEDHVERSLAFADKLLDAAHALLSQANIDNVKTVGDPRVVAEMMFIRTVSNFRGVVALAREKMAVEMLILARCCYENMFYIARLIEDGTAFVDELKSDHARSTKALAEMLFQRGAINDEETEKRIRDNLRTMAERFPESKFLSTKSVALNSALRDGYPVYSELSSIAGHPTLRSIERYLKQDDQGHWIDANFVSEPRELCCGLYFASRAMLGALVGFNQIIGGREIGKTFGVLADEGDTLAIFVGPSRA